MTLHAHKSTLGALDAFWTVVRRQADNDPDFAAALATALGIPVEIRIETPADVKANMIHLDPVVIAGRGLDEFRAVFGKLPDAERKKVAVAYNLVPADDLKGKGAPKGDALLQLLWDAASMKRARMERRARPVEEAATAK